MSSRRRHMMKSADARSRQLRRRLYKGAAIATQVYVGLSIVNFLAKLPSLPYELAIIWAVLLLCYTSFREALRWNNIDDDNYRGEFWAALIVAGAIFMIAWNIGRRWIFHLDKIPFPEDYEAAVIETIVLYTLSGISSFVYGRERGKIPARRRAGVRAPRGRQKNIEARQEKPTVSEPMLNPEVDAVLTRADTLKDKNDERKNLI